MTDLIRSELDDHGVLLATFNRPEVMNAINDATIRALRTVLQRASQDDDVRTLVLTGEGRAFCAGADLSGSNPGSGGDAPSRYQRLDRRGGSAETVQEFAQCDVPIIAAINGPAAGAGFGIACCADIRFMAASARMGTIFAKRGIATDYGTAYWLPRIVGTQTAYHMLYTGDLLSADDALAAGLVYRVVPDDELLDSTIEYARRIAGGAPLAQTLVRRQVIRNQELSMSELLELEWVSQTMVLGSDDAREGFAAYHEKRTPQFKGH
jgi:2-(1,2-epoxy-1,2-dihydrophenyl)acetyl-CoA isomerase